MESAVLPGLLEVLCACVYCAMGVGHYSLNKCYSKSVGVLEMPTVKKAFTEDLEGFHGSCEKLSSWF